MEVIVPKSPLMDEEIAEIKDRMVAMRTLLEYAYWESFVRWCTN